ncbi:MAG: hypothetical protein AAF665_07775 [Pseudomonadota bacterium]
MRVLFGLFLCLLLASCAATGGDDASPEAVRAAAFVPSGPPKLTLLTVVNNKSGAGAHTALVVTSSEQVIFDPAGSFRRPDVAERGDVLYGMSPAWVQGFKSAHARNTYHVVSQEIEVTPEQAALALQLVKINGAVGSAFCTNATSSVLRQIPGFQDVRVTFFPTNLMEQIAQRPDVVMTKYFENDAGDIVDGVSGVQI